jgi:mRNA interferase RelE/StbE
VPAALQIWSHTFCKAFDRLSPAVQESILRKVGARLNSFPHHRLTGRSEYRLRIADFRVLYEFDSEAGRLFLHYVGHRREIYRQT